MKNIKLFIAICLAGFLPEIYGSTLNTTDNDSLKSSSLPGKLVLNKWTYIQVDSTRGKWGDFAPPDWLAYFGLSASDVNSDGFPDIISGRYFYINPRGDMTGKWKRIDLGQNVDAILFADVDGDKFADCIAEALPDLFWLEAADTEGKSWNATKIASLPATRHINGQGFKVAQIIPGYRPEIVLSTGKGIYYLVIPANPEDGNWPLTQAAPEATEQGLGVGDIDGDGLNDIVASYGGDAESSKLIGWWRNPGDKTGKWKLNKVGNTGNYSADRLAVADLNSDGYADILVTEESWQTEDLVAQLFLFSQKRSDGTLSWNHKSILTSGSLNSLDIEDLDHDGDIDIVTGEHKGKEKRVFILENESNGNFTVHVIDHSNKESHLGTLLFDMDGDGDLDILSIAWNDYRFLHLWRNDAVK